MKRIKNQYLMYLCFFASGFCISEQRALYAKTCGRNVVTQHASAATVTKDLAWKAPMREEFLQDLAYLQNIVVQGETPSQTAEFLCYFTNQTLWFDRMLELATNPTDAILHKLKQQKTMLNTIVGDQKETEKILQDRLKDMRLVSPRYTMLRLMILYEINSLIQKNKKRVSDQQKNLIVDKMLARASLEVEQPSLDQNKAEILVSNQELVQLKEENASLKEYAHDQMRQRVGAELKMQLTQELADRRIQEYSKHAVGVKNNKN